MSEPRESSSEAIPTADDLEFHEDQDLEFQDTESQRGEPVPSERREPGQSDEAVWPDAPPEPDVESDLGAGQDDGGLPAVQPEEEKDSITFKRTHLYAVLLPLAFALGLSVGFLFWGRSEPPAAIPAGGQSSQGGSSSTAQSPPTSEVPEVNYDNIVRYDVPIDDDPVLGPSDAPITIIEFSDYECPFCKKWHAEVYQRLLQSYPDEIRLVYRDFPLTNIHPNAVPAAQAANCAHEQGRFWEYHDKLFEGAYGLGEDAYMQYALEVDLNIPSFEQCIAEDRYVEEIQADFDFAAQMGVSSTPTFFINGIALIGAQPFEVFQQVIDAELAGEIPP